MLTGDDGSRKIQAGLTATLFTLGFWLAYRAFDLPLPFFDDIAFAGTAVRLATGHGFGNPWLRQWFDFNPFFIYPPAYFYILAGWLKLFGVSAAAIETFYAVLGLVITATFGRMLRSTLSVGAWIYVALCLVTATAITYDGFRPDTLGLALLGAGLYVGTFFGGNMAVFGASFLLALTVMTAPSLATYAVGLGLWVFWRQFLSPLDNKERLKKSLPVLLAAGLSVAIFFLMIDFRLKEFFDAFGANSEARRVFWPLKNLLALHPLVGLAAVLANGAFLFAPTGNRKARELYAIISASLLASFFIHVHDIAFNFFLFGGALIFGVAILGGRPAGKIVTVTYITLLTIFNGPLIEFLFLRQPVDPALYQQVRKTAEELSNSGQTVIIDSVALRYVFNENPPPQYIDLIYSRKINPNIQVTDLNYFPHDAQTVWVAGCHTLALKAGSTKVGMTSVPSLLPLSRVLNPKRWQFPLKNWQIAVIQFGQKESFAGECAPGRID